MPGVVLAAAACAAMTGSGRVRAEGDISGSSRAVLSGSGSNAVDCGSSIGCCVEARLGSFIVVGDGGRGVRSSIIDR